MKVTKCLIVLKIKFFLNHYFLTCNSCAYQHTGNVLVCLCSHEANTMKTKTLVLSAGLVCLLFRVRTEKCILLYIVKLSIKQNTFLYKKLVPFVLSAVSVVGLVSSTFLYLPVCTHTYKHSLALPKSISAYMII